MFSYFGSKSSLAHLYPKPKHSLIIEPFAGSARYSLRYFEREVLLIDKYKVLVDIWHYLQQASVADVLRLPRLKHGDSIDNYATLSQVEKDFLGFLVCNGVGTPRKNVASFEGVNVARDLDRISKQLYKIRHWQITQGEYTDAPDAEATWFVDPPYQHGGQHHYAHNNKTLDFAALRLWCEARKGQTIVCENNKASWMPFVFLGKHSGTRHVQREVFWTNEAVEYQAELF